MTGNCFGPAPALPDGWPGVEDYDADSYRRWQASGRPLAGLMENWLLANESRVSAPQKNEHQWATFELMDLPRDEPEIAWAFLQAALQDRRFDQHVGILAAGPLEDLLSHHGPAFIERIEHAARVDPRFAFMLGGVWKSRIGDDVWHRVQDVWERRGWDGIPLPPAKSSTR